ncbi:MAG: hypothetical protein JNJ89_13385 [Rubrivivax sp.]|nr:hypothetical protein [Rubrivivax sp.]
MRDTVDHAAERIHSKLKSGGSTDDVMCRYESPLSEHPNRRSDILSQGAYSWAWLNEYEKAIADLHDVVSAQAGPRLAASLSHLSGLLLGLGRLSEAERVLSRLVAVEDAEGSTYFAEYAHLTRAFCLARLGKSSQALEELRFVPEGASVDWLEGTPVINCVLVRKIAAIGD